MEPTRAQKAGSVVGGVIGGPLGAYVGRKAVDKVGGAIKGSTGAAGALKEANNRAIALQAAAEFGDGTGTGAEK
jgi:hypothetical protein